MKGVLTECVVRNVFEKPKMLDDYTVLHPKVILSDIKAFSFEILRSDSKGKN